MVELISKAPGDTQTMASQWSLVIFVKKNKINFFLLYALDMSFFTVMNITQYISYQLHDNVN